MDNMCDDLLLLITTFNDCKNNIMLKHTSKLFNKISPCKGSKYKELLGCSKHINRDDVSYVIDMLNYNSSKNKFNYIIHFQSRNQLFIAEKYLNDFGRVSHFCCNGKGVVYFDKNHILSDINYLRERRNHFI
tara:strand:- start:172 stop:567 length:396 start_codon:yes stop_codon:yes gene_type:complete